MDKLSLRALIWLLKQNSMVTIIGNEVRQIVTKLKPRGSMAMTNDYRSLKDLGS